MGGFSLKEPFEACIHLCGFSTQIVTFVKYASRGQIAAKLVSDAPT